MEVKELHEHNVISGYAACNENLTTWREMLNGVEVDNAASICSGGEVSFFCVLPCVKKQLVLVDHSLNSLWWAVGKLGAIEALGPAVFHSKVRSIRASAYGFAGEKAATELYSCFEAANSGIFTSGDRGYGNSSYRVREVAAVWKKDVLLADVNHLHANRDKIAFIHGDLADLEAVGPFDFVYLSNAMEYRNRNGKTPRPAPLVKPGGLVAYTSRNGNNYGIDPVVASWETVEQKQTKWSENGYGLNWKHTLARKPA